MCDQLIRKAASGDKSAFEELVNGYYSKIYSVCFRILKNEQDALDASQEVLVKLYLNIKSFSRQSKLSTWIFTISRNTSLDIIRKKKEAISLDELSETGYSIPDYSAPEDDIIKKTEVRQIKEALNSMSEEHRQCLILKDVDGYSIESISEILNLPIGTVKSRIHRAREKLLELTSQQEWIR